jgi:2-oxoglutarate ferredoxin oxidoreductase subunit beta
MTKGQKKLDTAEKNTWCPGCLNFVTLAALKKALRKLESNGQIDLDSTVLVTDIGCGAKIYDYINVNAVYSLHGRVLPVASGIKAANPKLTVIGFGGDGGTYNEGMNHLIHSSRRNVGITMIVGNNRVFALTKGQPTATNDGLFGKPIDAIRLTREAGATFSARASALDPESLENILETAITHKGFSLVEIIQPCLIFKNDIQKIRKETEKIRSAEIPKPKVKPVWEEEIRAGLQPE